jgi:hypothetical protein
MPTHVEFRNGKAILSIADYEELAGKAAKDVVQDNALEAFEETKQYEEPVLVTEKRERQDEATPDTTQNGVLPNATQRNADPLPEKEVEKEFEVPAKGSTPGTPNKKAK